MFGILMQKYRILCLGAGGVASYNFRDALKLDDRYSFEFYGQDTNKYQMLASGIAPDSWIEDPYRANVDFIHPQPDPQVLELASNLDTLQAKTFLPNLDSISICHNKTATMLLLKLYDIPVPLSIPVENIDNIEHMLAREEKVWLRAIYGAGSKAALPISSMVQAEGWLDYWEQKGIPTEHFIVSEFLPGKEYAFQAIYYHGELIVSQARERKEYMNANLMPSGQSSSPSIATTINNPTVNQTGTQAIEILPGIPHGIYGVDMKENRQGIPCVTEINIGRFYTTSNFFAYAGLNMPSIYLELGLTGTTTYTGPQYDPLPAGISWIRAVDRPPYLSYETF